MYSSTRSQPTTSLSPPAQDMAFSWFFPQEAIDNKTPSRADGISVQFETRYRKDGARFIISAANTLKLYPYSLVGYISPIPGGTYIFISGSTYIPLSGGTSISISCRAHKFYFRICTTLHVWLDSGFLWDSKR